MVSLVLLTASVGLGVSELVRFARPNWPRFVVAALHRNVSLLATAFLAVHITTAVADSFASIRITDVLVPFIGVYRPFWLGLGTLAFDLILALVITSLLRERLGFRAWRAVHWAAYAAWPLALVHGLGTGSDTRVRWAAAINVLCLAVVLAAVLTRVGWTRTVSSGRRTVAVLGSMTVAIGVTTWMLLEPMRPGWARKAGTPSTLLTATQAPGTTTSLIPIPFTSAVRGSISQASPDGSGLTTVRLDAALTSLPGARLRVVIHGAALAGGGVNMQSSSARLGYAGAENLYRGTITSLDGTRVVASMHTSGGAGVVLAMNFSVDPGSNALTGTVSGRSGSGAR
jgi:sulfoxide reductase heme-binding subunit YedZ